MKNKIDNIVKKHLEHAAITPSKRVGRIIAFKTFFQNLLIFHKLKLIAGFATVVAVSSVYVYSEYNYSNSQCNCKVSDNLISNSSVALKGMLIAENKEDITNSERLMSLAKDENSSVEQVDGSLTSIPFSNEETKEKNSNVNTNSYIDVAANSSSQNTSENSNQSFSSKKKLSNRTIDHINGEAKSGHIASNQADELVDKAEHSMNSQLERKSLQDETEMRYNSISPKMMETTIDNKSVDQNFPELNLTQDDYATNTKTRGLSLDAYCSIVSKAKVANELDKGYNYYWDFYKEGGYIKSLNGGVNVNYLYNGFKFHSGLGFTKINEIRPNYEYIYDTTTFVPYGGYVVSGTVVNEQDTTLILYTPNEKEVIDAFQIKYNSYSYITVPLAVGYEFFFKKMSVEINAGIVYQRRINQNGLSVKVEDYNNEAKSIFYYKDRYMTTLDNNKNALTNNLFASNYNLVLRRRISSQLDIMTGFNYSSSFNSIYQKSYFLKKNINNYGVNLGITYYFDKRI